MSQPTRNWRAVIGDRLRLFREQAHGGKGITHKKAADTIQRSEAYVVRLETSMGEENPTLNMLEQLVTLYGRTVGELFEPLMTSSSNKIVLDNVQFKEKLDYILSKPDENAVAIGRNIDAMYRMAIDDRRKKKETKDPDKPEK